MRKNLPRKRGAPFSGPFWTGIPAFCALLLFLFIAGHDNGFAASITPDQEIYIPVSELGKLPQSATPAILLTREEYQKLLADAFPRDGLKTEEKPIPAAFESAIYEATAVTGSGGKGECLDVQALYNLRVFSATWSEAPFDFGQTPPVSVRVDGSWIVNKKPGHPGRLFIFGSGAHKVSVRFLVPVIRDPARSRVDLPVPIASSGMMQIRFNGNQDVESPLPVKVSHGMTETLALVGVGGASRIQFSWSPSRKSAGGETSLNETFPLFVESHLSYSVDESLVEISGTLLYNTLSGDLPLRLSCRIPDGASLRELKGAGVTNWQVAANTVTLDRVPGGRDSLELTVKIEVPFEPGPDRQLPMVSVPIAFRHYGMLAVAGARGLRLRVREALAIEPVDPAEFFGTAANLPGQFLASYRFFTEPVSLAFEAQKVAAEMEATAGAWVSFQSDAVHLTRYVEIFQKKGESQRVTFLAPRDEVIVKILDKADQEVDFISSASGEWTLIRIDLPKGLASGEASAFTVVSSIYPPNYTGLDEKGIDVTLASIRVLEAARQSGTVALGVESILRLTDLEIGELETAPRPAEHPDAIQAFFFRNNYNLKLHVSRKPSEVEALVLLDLLPKQGFLSVQGEVHYTIRNSGRKNFSIAFPRGTGNEFFIDGQGIKERNMVSEEKWDHWNLTIQDDRIGNVVLQFKGDLRMNGEITVPEIWIPGAVRERGYLVTEANTETEIEFTATGLGSVDALDVPKLSRYTPVHRIIAAYRYFVHPWSLQLKVTRHETEPVLKVVADQLDLMTLIASSGVARSRAAYSIRGVRTAFVTVSLPKGSNLWSSQVNNQPVKPMDGGRAGTYMIPLGGQIDRNKALSMELIYETAQTPFDKSGNTKILAPKLGGGIPVEQTRWTVYLPDGYAYTNVKSDLKLLEAPQPMPLVVAGLQGFSSFGTLSTYNAEMRNAPLFMESIYQDQDRYHVEALRSLGYGGGSAPEIPQSAPAGTPIVHTSSLPDESTSGNGILQTREPSTAGEPAATGETMLDGFGSDMARDSVDWKDVYISSAGDRVAGILPFEINLVPQGVEYIFRDLKEGEHVSLKYRRLESLNARKVIFTLLIGFLFAAWARNRKLVKPLIWAVFILTALPYAFGRSWSEFCNEILIGILLGAALVLVMRLRYGRLKQSAVAAMLALGICAGTALQASASPVYIPYDANHPESATAVSRVLVPRDRFQELWYLARANQVSATEIIAPASYSLDNAEYDVALGNGVASIDALYRLFLPQDGWVTVDLPFSGAKLGELTLDGSPARIEQSSDGYRIHIREAGSHELKVQLSAKIPSPLSQGTLVMGIPPTFAGRVRIHLPRKDLTAVAAPGPNGSIETITESGRDILVGLSHSRALEITWYPEATEERPESPMNAAIQIQHSVVGVIENWTASIDLAFTGEKHSEFEFDLDPTVTFTAMDIPNQRDWTIREEAGKRSLKVRLIEAVANSLRVVLTGERKMTDAARTVPLVTVRGARQSGTRALLAGAPWLDLRVEPVGFRRITDKGPGIEGLRSAGTFETEREGDRLNYQVVERPQEIQWKLDYLFQVESRKIESIVLVNAEIKRRPLFNLALQIPAGYRCESVEGEKVKEWWETPGNADADGRVDVEFSGGVIGKSHFIVHLIRQYADQPETLAVRPVRLSTTGWQVDGKIEGSVLIATHVSVEPRPVSEIGLRSTTLCGDAADKPECKVGGGLEVTLPLQKKLAYWFEQPDFSAEFRLEKVEPRYNVTWTTLAQTHETWVSYYTHVVWQLRSGSRRTWEFHAPVSLGEIAVTGDRVREVAFTDNGDTRQYVIHLDSEVFSSDSVNLTYETPIQESAKVPHLEFPGADPVSGYILTGNESPFELSAEPSGELKSAQISDVPYLPVKYGVLGYYKVFRGSWDLNLKLARTVTAETLAAVIDWIDLETQIRRDGSTLNQAHIRMQNKTLQFLAVRLPEKAMLLSLFVANQAVGANKAVRGGNQVFLVPLIKTAVGDLSYEVEIDYETPAMNPIGLRERINFLSPEILDIPVGQTFWTFYVPPEYGFHRIGGNMEETTVSLREATKIYAKEEERQRLKGILIGNYDTGKKERALSNYLNIQNEISSSNAGNWNIDIGKELAENPRLQQQARVLNERRSRLNEEIDRNLKADQSGELQTQIEEIRQKASEAPVAGVQAEGEKIITWDANGVFMKNQPLAAQPPAQFNLETIQQETGYLQVGANVYYAPIDKEGREQAQGEELEDTAAEGKVNLFNLGRSQRKTATEKQQEEKYPQQAQQSFRFREESQQAEYGQKRVGGHFRGKSAPQAGDTPDFRTVAPQGAGKPLDLDDYALDNDEEKALQSQPQPQAQFSVDVPQSAIAPHPSLSQDQLLTPSAGTSGLSYIKDVVGATGATVTSSDDNLAGIQTAKVEGIYSIPIPLPREGRIIAFKKLKAGAQVRYTLLASVVPLRIKRIVITMACAAILWLLMWSLNRASARRFLGRVWPWFGILPGLAMIPFNPPLSFLLLVIWVLAMLVWKLRSRMSRRQVW